MKEKFYRKDYVVRVHSLDEFRAVLEHLEIVNGAKISDCHKNAVPGVYPYHVGWHSHGGSWFYDPSPSSGAGVIDYSTFESIALSETSTTPITTGDYVVLSIKREKKKILVLDI